MNKSDYKKLVYEKLNQKDFFAKKKFSQNFLLDDNIINKIIKQSQIDESTSVIEIGPGLGALTKELVPLSKKVLIYEVDKDLIPTLDKLFSDYKNYVILNQDFLKADIDKDISEFLDLDSKIVLISNLPYHITTPIIMKVLEESKKIDSLVLMMQLEVARRITSPPNTKDYNALSIIIQHQAKAKFLFKVPKTVFNPRPNVDSAVIRLDIDKNIKESGIDYKNFYKFVHSAFAQRRKTFVNNISGAYDNVSKEELVNLLVTHQLDERIRSEAIKLDEFLILFDELKYKIFEEKENGVKENR